MELHTSEKDTFKENSKRDWLIVAAGFVGSALIGYFLTNYVALIGA